MGLFSPWFLFPWVCSVALRESSVGSGLRGLFRRLVDGALARAAGDEEVEGRQGGAALLARGQPQLVPLTAEGRRISGAKCSGSWRGAEKGSALNLKIGRAPCARTGKCPSYKGQWPNSGIFIVRCAPSGTRD